MQLKQQLALISFFGNVESQLRIFLRRFTKIIKHSFVANHLLLMRFKMFFFRMIEIIMEITEIKCTVFCDLYALYCTKMIGSDFLMRITLSIIIRVS